MKNILIPTDFSACANYATEAAFLFAEKLGANLHFLTCIHIPHDWDNYSEERKNNYPEAKQLISNANQLFEKIRIKAVKKGISLETSISGGEFMKAVQKEVIATQADFVVMGSHGKSGKPEYLMGSNAQQVVRKIHLPVFVTKDPLKKLSFKQVIFASTFNTEDKTSFARFLDFIRPFQPETIHLLSIDTFGWFSQPTQVMKAAMEDFKEMVKNYNCETHFHKSFSVDAGVRDFAETINADLMVISNHERHPIKRIFQGSNVEAIVNHTDLPVLSIDFAALAEATEADKLITREYLL